MTQNTQQPESQVLSRMMVMLEQLMDRVQSRDVPTHRGSSRLQRRYGRNACRVCQDNKHSTVTHCITDKLCFECFSPGHPKRDCPKLSLSGKIRRETRGPVFGGRQYGSFL